MDAQRINEACRVCVGQPCSQGVEVGYPGVINDASGFGLLGHAAGMHRADELMLVLGRPPMVSFLIFKRNNCCCVVVHTEDLMTGEAQTPGMLRIQVRPSLRCLLHAAQHAPSAPHMLTVGSLTACSALHCTGWLAEPANHVRVNITNAGGRVPAGGGRVSDHSPKLLGTPNSAAGCTHIPAKPARPLLDSSGLGATCQSGRAWTVPPAASQASPQVPPHPLIASLSVCVALSSSPSPVLAGADEQRLGECSLADRQGDAAGCCCCAGHWSGLLPPRPERGFQQELCAQGADWLGGQRRQRVRRRLQPRHQRCRCVRRAAVVA